MELKKAEITGFGHYRNQTFEFLSGNQLFYGDNEVGKSTLYQFILTMLFGFSKKSSKKRDYTPRDGAAYGGRLWLIVEPYGEILIERFRKVNRGKAKLFIEGAEKDEKILTEILAPLNKVVFQDVFTFQQEQLTQIDRLEEKELQTSLISLGITGSQQLMEKIQTYQKENQQLFKPRAKKLTLNQQLRSWQDLKETIQQQEAEEENVQKAYQKIADFDQELQDLSEEQKKLQTEEKSLNQKKSHWSLYEEWLELRAMEKSRVSEEEQKELRHFYHEYQNLTEKIQKKEDELAQLEQGQESDRYFFYLDHEKEIQDLLHLDVPIMRLKDEKQQLFQNKEDLDQILLNLKQKWGWTEQTPPQDLTDSIDSAISKVEQLNEQIRQKELQIQWLKERRRLAEEEIDQLEKKYPELLNSAKTQKSSLFFTLGIGFSFIAAGWFLSMPLNLITFAIGIMSLGIAALKSYQKKNPSSKIKPTWQEKLLQLDSYAEEIFNEENNLKRLKQQEQKLNTELQAAFGQYNTMQDWHVIVQTYRNDQEKYEKAISDYASIQGQLTTANKQRNELEARFQFLAEWLPIANKELSEKQEIVQKFSAQMQETKMTRLQQPSTLLAQQLKQNKEERNQLFADYTTLLEMVGLEQPTEIPLWIKQWEARQKKLTRKDELAAILHPIFPKDITHEQLTQYLAENQATQEKIQEQTNQVLEEKQRLQLQVEYLQKNGTLDMLYQEENRMLSEIHETALKWSTNQLLIAFLSDLASELSEQQLPQLFKQTSYYFALLTNGHYQKVLLVDGVINAVSKEETFAIYELSTGTKDQLIMAIRFAYLFMQKERSISPVIIDDGWLHYDSTRKENLAKLLEEFGKDYQVICLSSDKEMVSYYQRLEQSVIKF
ncbi:AAA family ATPase [Tetragenococcus koreensis]|uniref:ATP-binding protein n=1 Tax=Tetragenococcus koreensis TaxID=290335 RepID=UPI001F199E70|nr:AAA family ATPase [Tetragenococcus koreensis]MCF1584954.1 AAA family ATPase [Tetragenococcus koreensis]MCF1614467.1 AAA family ATPase [Tetragenococcus koreensis]MCF1617222.1 AAA family ATPase [Tetragenococcus koreensis]MCF1619870.1 AAA family ATPase [Tetragenococcus koreensis]MCF1622103.1 AAA family ATPase [Tetragenococcus koreensis]